MLSKRRTTTRSADTVPVTNGVLFTSVMASLRGFDVVVPVDGMAGNNAYEDQARITDCSLIADADKMIDKVVRAHQRFIVNMARIAGLMKLVMSGEGQFKATRFMQYEGVGADIFRLIVVFLHAAVEDLVRSQLPGNKNFSFQSGPDIDKAINHAGFDSSSLKPLYRPLTAMAKRRNRIVHKADLTSDSIMVVEPWGVADVWQEVVTRTFPEGPGEVDVVAIYEVENGKIAKAWFKMGPPRLHAGLR